MCAVQLAVIVGLIILSDLSITTISEYKKNTPVHYIAPNEIELVVSSQNDNLGIIQLHSTEPILVKSDQYTLDIYESGTKILSSATPAHDRLSQLTFGLPQTGGIVGKTLSLHIKPVKQHVKNITVILKSQIQKEALFRDPKLLTYWFENKINTAYETGSIPKIILRSFLPTILFLILLLARKIFPTSLKTHFHKYDVVKLYPFVPVIFITIDTLLIRYVLVLHTITIVSLIVALYNADQKNTQRYFYRYSLLLFIIAALLTLADYENAAVKLTYWVYVCIILGLIFESAEKLQLHFKKL